MPRLIYIVALASLIATTSAGWAQRNSLPTSFDLFRIASGPDAFVAVGDGSVIIRSTDSGSTWSQVPSGIELTSSVYSIYENDEYSVFPFTDLAYDPNGGVFVALAFETLLAKAVALVYSANSSGSSFTPVPNFVATGLQQVPVYGNKRWVGLSFANPPTALIATSLSAGLTSQPLQLDCNCQVRSAPAWSKSLNAFTMVLDREIAISSDGVNWKSIYQNEYPPMPYQMSGQGVSPVRPNFVDPVWVYYTDNGTVFDVRVDFTNPAQPNVTLVMVAHTQSTNMQRFSPPYWQRLLQRSKGIKLQYCTDGASWIDWPVDLPKTVSDVAWTLAGGSTYTPLAVGVAGGVYAASSSKVKQLNTPGVQGNFWTGRYLAGPKAGFYATGNAFGFNAAPLSYSSDGHSWSVITTVGGGAVQDVQYVASAGLYVVVPADSHVVYYSSDGFAKVHNYTIPKQKFPSSKPTPGITCGGDAPAIVVPTSMISGTIGCTLVSLDKGKTWDFIWVNGTQPNEALNTCAYGNGVYVGFTDTTVFTSTDNGTHWTETATFSLKLPNVVFVGSHFVAVSDNGIVTYSSDGHVWSVSSVPGGDGLNGVTFANGQYVVVGDYGAAYTSPDLLTWTRMSVPAYVMFTDVAWSPSTNNTVIVGYGGLVMTSQ